MLTIEQIVALLESKFQGARKDVLTNLAGVIALQAEDEESANAIIEHMSADGVQKFGQTYRSRIDKEIQQSNQSFEKNLRQKYDFKEKGQQDPDQNGGTLTIDQVRQLMAEQLQPFTQRMDAFESTRQGIARREAYQAKLKESKLSSAAEEMLMSNFDRMRFKDDEEFNSFVSTQTPIIQKMSQEYADLNLRNDRKPLFGVTGNDGVSAAMKDYLENKNNDGGSPLGGKSL